MAGIEKLTPRDERRVKRLVLRSIGVFLLLAGPFGWITADQIAAVHSALAALGGVDTASTGVSGAGVAFLLADAVGERRSRCNHDQEG